MKFMIVALGLVALGPHVIKPDGIISVRFASYYNFKSTDYLGMCCDGGGWCISACDNYFTFCIRMQGDPKCSARNKTGIFRDDSLAFPTDLENGLSNPVLTEFKGAYSGNVSFEGDVWDEDMADVDDLVDLFSANITVKVAPNEEKSKEKVFQIAGSHTSLNVAIRVFCKESFVGPNCEYHCQPKDDSTGHYTCDPLTGEKRCMRGWKGEKCDMPTCRPGCSTLHGNCSRPDECICTEGWEGYNCTRCIRKPGCQNGYCREAYECRCRESWAGELCDKDRDSCRSKPCHNGGDCKNTGPGAYQCHCLLGYKGKNCEIELDPCTTHHEYYAEGRTPDDHIEPGAVYRNDQLLVPGWYRVRDSRYERLSEKCYPMYYCGTKYPIYLKRDANNKISSNGDAKVCVSSCLGCCHMSMDVKVRSCRVNGTSFSVYKLKPTLSEEIGYCFE